MVPAALLHWRGRVAEQVSTSGIGQRSGDSGLLRRLPTPSVKQNFVWQTPFLNDLARCLDKPSIYPEPFHEPSSRRSWGAPAGDDSQGRLRAEACLAAARDEGIAREDVEEETGDLVAYMGAAIANLVNHGEQDAASTEDNREQLIRTKAYYIRLDKGRPDGRWRPSGCGTRRAPDRPNRPWPRAHPVAEARRSGPG